MFGFISINTEKLFVFDCIYYMAKNRHVDVFTSYLRALAIGRNTSVLHSIEILPFFGCLLISSWQQAFGSPWWWWWKWKPTHSFLGSCGIWCAHFPSLSDKKCPVMVFVRYCIPCFILYTRIIYVYELRSSRWPVLNLPHRNCLIQLSCSPWLKNFMLFHVSNILQCPTLVNFFLNARYQTTFIWLH